MGFDEEIETAEMVYQLAVTLRNLSTRAKEGNVIAHKAIELAKEGIDGFLADAGPTHEIIVIMPPKE